MPRRADRQKIAPPALPKTKRLRTANTSKLKDRANVPAATARESKADVADCAGIAEKHFRPSRPATPADEAEGKNREDFEQAGKMIWADIKAACPPAVIEALEEWDKHEVIPAAKLNGADYHLSEGDQKEKKDQVNPSFRRGKNAGGKKINEEPAENRKDVRACDRRDGRKCRPNENITEENRRRPKADFAGPRFRARGEQAKKSDDREKSVNRQTKNQARPTDQRLHPDESERENDHREKRSAAPNDRISSFHRARSLR